MKSVLLVCIPPNSHFKPLISKWKAVEGKHADEAWFFGELVSTSIDQYTNEKATSDVTNWYDW